MATEAERIWRAKTDQQLLEAAGELHQCTAEGQHVIRAELKRRGFEDPVEQKGEAALEPFEEGAPPRECMRCNAEMRFFGTRIESGNWAVLGEMPKVIEMGASFDVYVCPECTRVELFLNLPAEDQGPGADEEETTG